MNMKVMGAALLAGAVIVGCNKQSEETASAEDVALTVNGKTLTKAAIAADVEKVRQEFLSLIR